MLGLLERHPVVVVSTLILMLGSLAVAGVLLGTRDLAERPACVATCIRCKKPLNPEEVASRSVTCEPCRGPCARAVAARGRNSRSGRPERKTEYHADPDPRYRVREEDAVEIRKMYGRSAQEVQDVLGRMARSLNEEQ